MRKEPDDFERKVFEWEPEDGPVFKFVMRLVFWTPIAIMVALVVLASYWFKTTFIWR